MEAPEEETGWRGNSALQVMILFLFVRHYCLFVSYMLALKRIHEIVT